MTLARPSQQTGPVLGPDAISFVHGRWLCSFRAERQRRESGCGASGCKSAELSCESLATSRQSVRTALPEALGVLLFAAGSDLQSEAGTSASFFHIDETRPCGPARSGRRTTWPGMNQAVQQGDEADEASAGAMAGRRRRRMPARGPFLARAPLRSLSPVFGGPEEGASEHG